MIASSWSSVGGSEDAKQHCAPNLSIESISEVETCSIASACDEEPRLTIWSR